MDAIFNFPCIIREEVAPSFPLVYHFFKWNVTITSATSKTFTVACTPYSTLRVCWSPSSYSNFIDSEFLERYLNPSGMDSYFLIAGTGSGSGIGNIYYRWAPSSGTFWLKIEIENFYYNYDFRLHGIIFEY